MAGHQREILDVQTIHVLRNLHPAPKEAFEIEPKELAWFCKCYGTANVVLWHSHPKTRAMLSRADGELLQQIQPIPMIVVSLSALTPLIRCYEWGRRGPIEVASYRVLETPS